MLREFALEPALLSNWDRFQFFMSNFGVHLGRLISRYPKKWELLVVAGLENCGDVEKKRIVEGLIRIRDRLYPRHHEWDDKLSWLENSEVEHGKRPFHAIIAAANPGNTAFILSDIDVTNPPTLWKAGAPKPVLRRAADMAEAVRLLLQMSKTILFIDRNFRPKDKGFRAALAAFLAASLDRNNKCQARRIEYHTGNEVAPYDFSTLCNGWLPELIPEGVKVKFVRWNHADLHNRYIVTENGGFMFGQGLDEAGDTDQQEDVISILDKAVAEQILNDFIGAVPKYKWDNNDVIVTGRKKA